MNRIGRYQIVGELGQGGMGKVFRALDPKLRRVVALKTIRFDLIAEGAGLRGLVERFQLEAQAAAGLNHPNIVTIYDVGEEEGVAYIVMEFVDGQTLRQLTASPGRMDSVHTVRILHDTACALDYAHDMSILHRDVKPGNILVGKNGTAKLADFGIAKINSVTGLTRSGTVLGTLHYIAPEHLKGLTLDKRADQYSLAVVAYEALSGAVPFDAPSPESLMLRVLLEPPTSILEHYSSLPQAVDQVMRTALAKEPSNRYETCVEFVLALADALAISRIELAVRDREFAKCLEDRAWRSASSARDPEGIQAFLEEYPSGVHNGEARQLYERLVSEQAAWDAVRESSAPGPIRDFLARFTNGRFSAEAQALLATLESNRWTDIRNSLDPRDFQTFLSSFPNGQFADLGRQKLKEANQHEREWEESSHSRDVKRVRSFLERYPSSPHKGHATQVIAALEHGEPWGSSLANPEASNELTLIATAASDAAQATPRTPLLPPQRQQAIRDEGAVSTPSGEVFAPVIPAHTPATVPVVQWLSRWKYYLSGCIVLGILAAIMVSVFLKGGTVPPPPMPSAHKFVEPAPLPPPAKITPPDEGAQAGKRKTPDTKPKIDPKEKELKGLQDLFGPTGKKEP